MYVDPRGLRFGAVVTTIVLALGLLTQSVWVLAFQTVVFALGAIVGLQAIEYRLLYPDAGAHVA